MTECNGCGACCQPVILPYSPADIAIHGQRLDPETVAFYHEHLTPMSRADGRAIVGSWSGGYSEIFDGERWVLLAAFYYQCDRYDPVSKQCGDYEHRPSMCRDYPWYGDLPDPQQAAPADLLVPG